MKINELYQTLTENIENGFRWKVVSKNNDIEKYKIYTEYNKDFDVFIKRGNATFDFEPEVIFQSIEDNHDSRDDVTGHFAKININPVRVFSTIITIISKSQMIKNERVFYMLVDSYNIKRLNLYKRMLSKHSTKFKEYNVGKQTQLYVFL